MAFSRPIGCVVGGHHAQLSLDWLRRIQAFSEMMLTEIYLTIFSGASQPGHANVAACRHFRVWLPTHHHTNGSEEHSLKVRRLANPLSALKLCPICFKPPANS